MRHIIAIQLQNEAGALGRVAGLFSTRGYNIESLSVAPTDDPTVSRLTLVTVVTDAALTQLVNQLRKLIDVVLVENLTRGDHVERELLLLKLRVSPAHHEPLRQLVAAAHGQVLSEPAGQFVVEVTGSEAEVSRFLAQASQFGELLEVVRSGALGIRRDAAPVTRLTAA